MNKKSITALLIITLVLSLFLAGCGSKPTNILEKIKQKGVIVMGTSADFPPFEFHKVEGNKDYNSRF